VTTDHTPRLYALAASILGATLIRTGVKARERRRGTALERS